jgi:hypothetical protein
MLRRVLLQFRLHLNPQQVAAVRCHAHHCENHTPSFSTTFQQTSPEPVLVKRCIFTTKWREKTRLRRRNAFFSRHANRKAIGSSRALRRVFLGYLTSAQSAQSAGLTTSSSSLRMTSAPLGRIHERYQLQRVAATVTQQHVRKRQRRLRRRLRLRRPAHRKHTRAHN